MIRYHKFIGSRRVLLIVILNPVNGRLFKLRKLVFRLLAGQKLGRRAVALMIVRVPELRNWGLRLVPQMVSDDFEFPSRGQ